MAYPWYTLGIPTVWYGLVADIAICWRRWHVSPPTTGGCTTTTTVHACWNKETSIMLYVLTVVLQPVLFCPPVDHAHPFKRVHLIYMYMHSNVPEWKLDSGLFHLLWNLEGFFTGFIDTINQLIFIIPIWIIGGISHIYYCANIPTSCWYLIP